MIKNFLTVAYRNCKRQKVISFINIFGLAIGMFACICILQYVNYEKSYDRFHLNRKNIYRVQYNFYRNGEKKIESASAVPAVGPAMKDNFPEVIDFTRVFNKSGIISFKNSNYWENQVYAVTPSFFRIFSFPLIKGDPETALSGTFKIVLTESAAKKYFGEENPMGQMIRWDGEHEGNLNFEVTGICKDVPDNSHIKFSSLLSYQTFVNIRGDSGPVLENDWHWYDFYTYVLLKPEYNPVDFQNKFNNWLGVELKDVWRQYDIREEFLLQPIEDIHLYSHLSGELDPDGQGDGRTTNVLFLVAVFILVIAWVNYINLSSAQAIKRAKDVIIRKVSGAFRGQLIGQFISESIVINIVALILAVLLSALFFPLLNQFTNIELRFRLFFTTEFWLVFGGLFLAGTLLSSLYPAFVISSFKSSTVLKGSILKSTDGIQLRKYMLIFQFITSIILIAVVLVVSNQLAFMRNQDLKIDITQNLVIKGPTKLSSDSAYISQEMGFRNEMLKQSQVLSFSSGTKIPGLEVSSKQGIRKKEDSPDDIQSINVLGIDYNYIPSLKVSLVAGRDFSKTFKTDKSAILINESAVKMLGYENPRKALGHEIFFGDDFFNIIGVIEDYHHMSLKTAPVPLLYYLDEFCNDYFVLKTSGKSIDNTLKIVESKWQQFFPGNPFDYFFLDDFFEKQYKSDLNFRNILASFSVIAFLIAGLGLFALSSFMIEQRFKEIGIRKVNGAKVFEILAMLNKNFVKWVVIAFVIATPVAYFTMNKWLENFACKTSLSWWIFALSGLLALGIALLTVSWQSWRAATRNPVEALRYE